MNQVRRDLSTVALLGRFLLAFIFIASGLMKIPGWDQTSRYMASKGMPLIPFFLAGAIFIEVAIGLSMLFGYKTRFCATLIFLYLIPTTLIFHNFWALEGAEREIQLTNFLKNLSIMGGLLQVAAFGGGAKSIDAKNERGRLATRQAGLPPRARAGAA